MITADLIDGIVHILFSDGKKFTRICFVGTDRKSKRRLRHALSDRPVFSFAFINDMEKAKEWLILV